MMKLGHELEIILGQQPGLKMLNSMGFAVAALDTELKIAWSNTEYQRMQGMPEDGIRGRYCHEVSFGNQEPCREDQCPVQKTIRTGLEDRFLGIPYKGDQGMKYLDIYCFPLKSLEGEVTYVLEVIHDNTKLHELIKLSEKMTIMVSHELKSPLAAITTLASAILYPNVPEDQKARFLYRIISRAKGALRMIEEFLTLSTISLGGLTIEPSRLNFRNQVIEEAVDQQQEAIAEKGMSARIDVPGELEVVCDPRYIQIVYNNLIANAVRHSGAGTEIYLGYVGPQNGYHYFSVINVGEWIKESNRERIFEKYETLGERGTGIGLHTAKEIIRRHGGEIWVEPCYFARGKWICNREIVNEVMISEEYRDHLPVGNSFVFTIPAIYFYSAGVER